jgi:hypothetical protein
MYLQEDVGCIVGWAGGINGSEVRVSLRKVAERLIERGRLRPLSEDELRALEHEGRTDVGGVEVSGKIAKKIKKGIKKVAKKVATSKIVKGVVKIAAKVVPPPASFAITGAQAAVKIGKALKKGNPKAKKIAPLIKATAKGKVTPAKLKAEAKKAGVNPQLALEAAAVAKVAEQAQAGDPKAAAALNMASELTSSEPQEVAKAENTLGQLAVVQAAQEGNARAFVVTTPDGKTYKTIVVPAA